MPKNAKISKVLLVFHSPYRSSRLKYILNFVFTERLGLNYRFAEESENLKENLHIEYSALNSRYGFHISALGFLKEKASLPIDFAKNLISPYKAHDENQELPYPDIFSAIFFHLSRYEEYTAKKDEHGRFKYQSSCLYTENVLDQAIVDQWIIRLEKDLILYFGADKIQCKKSEFYIQPSLDIDSLFAYKGKNFFRQSAAMLRDLMKFNFKELQKRFSVVLGSAKDPNDNFALQQEILGDKKAMYFIQVGPYGKYDKNLSHENKEFRAVVKKLAEQGHRIGLHPSYGSNSELAKIISEKQIVESMTAGHVSTSRQHFLRFSLPSTFRTLIAAGITDDYSMGYSEMPGFRAGTAYSFLWYDIVNEQETNLRIHPFAVMDVVYKEFMKLGPEEAILASGKIMQECKQNKSPFVFVFHNESLSGHRNWEGWDKVFKFWTNG